jgi:hypothetical protein
MKQLSWLSEEENQLTTSKLNVTLMDTYTVSVFLLSDSLPVESTFIADVLPLDVLTTRPDDD